MKILLTNDDGIEAPGIQSLHDALRHALDNPEIIVVAPDRGRSECGHSVTTGRSLIVNRIAENWFSVDGTPVDCVRAALTKLAPNVDFVMSGVNAGANLGVDLLVSGTFAAAREASIEGIPAMAVSHYRRPDVPVTWKHVPGWTCELIQEFAAVAIRSNTNQSNPPGLLWNVNLPAIDPALPPPEIQRCDVDQCPYKRSAKVVTANSNESELTFGLDFHGRPRNPDRDVYHCFGGRTTLSELGPYVA